MYQSENIAELASALAKAQGEFVPALKDSANPFFKSKYANLCSIVKSCQEPLSRHGISFSQSTQKMDGEWVLITKLMHSSGQWVSSTTPIITLKPDIQSFGSASTYARRYSLAALAGVTTDEDDDGEASMSRDQPSPAQKKYEEKKEEKKTSKTKTVTEGQAKELDAMLGMCDLEFRNQVWNFLNSDAVGIKEMKQLPESLYQKIRDKIDNKINAAGKEEVKDE